MRAEYEILGIERGASRDEITAAYRRAAMRWHPDRNPGDLQAKERFQEVERAHRHLLQMTPPVRLAPEGAAASAAEVQAAMDAWRAARARQQRDERPRDEQRHAQEARHARRRQISSPLFTLSALAAAAAAAALLPQPLGLLFTSLLLFVAMLAAPRQPKTYLADVAAILATHGVRLYFVGLLAWLVWKMAQRTFG